MGFLKSVVQRAMALDLNTKDVKVRVAKLFNLSEDEAARLIVRARNELRKEGVRRAKRKIVFLPQCLRKRECRAELSEEGFACRRCSADCQARLIRDAALAAGAECFTVPGGTMVRNIIAKRKPNGVVGVACWKEADEGAAECDKAGVPAVGVTLLRDGCVNTLVDVEEVKALLEEVGLGASPNSSSSSRSHSKTKRVSKARS